MMLHKGWRLSAYPLSYRVERLKPCQWSPGQNPTWQEVQRLPRTRNTYIEQEHQCAVSMLHRCFNKALAKQEHGYDPLSPKANLDGVYAVGYVKQQLYGWPRYRYALRVALPMWLYDQHEWNKLMWREWNKLMWRVRTKLKAWRYRWVD